MDSSIKDVDRNLNEAVYCLVNHINTVKSQRNNLVQALINIRELNDDHCSDVRINDVIQKALHKLDYETSDISEVMDYFE